jgi:hypothetical protein
MKCLPSNNVMPESFNECCNCAHYDDCTDKREIKRVGIIWVFVNYFKSGITRFISKKAA